MSWDPLFRNSITLPYEVLFCQPCAGLPCWKSLLQMREALGCGWFLCDILHYFSKDGSTELTRYKDTFFFLQSTHWLFSRLDVLLPLCKINMALGKINFSSQRCGLAFLSKYAADVNEKLFFRTVFSECPEKSIWINAGGSVLPACIAVPGLYIKKHEHEKRAENEMILWFPHYKNVKGTEDIFQTNKRRCSITESTVRQWNSAMGSCGW